MNPHSNCRWDIRALWLVFVVCLLSTSATFAAGFEWTGSGGNLFWSTAGNWNPSGPPGIADTAIFGDTGTVGDTTTVNNIVGVDTVIAGLSYTNSIAMTWNVTEIPANTTLTVNGPVVVGGGNGSGLNTAVVMTGGGSFVATGSSFALGNTFNSSSATPGDLDLSGLSRFVYSSASGTLGIGRLSTGTGSRSTSTFTLAAGSNSITAGTIDMNGATGTSSKPLFNLGAGTNVINANTFNVGGGRSTTVLQFFDVTGGLRLRGVGGTDADRATMVVGNRNTGGTGTKNTSGSVLLNGHMVDLKLGTLTLGLMSRNAGGTDNGGYNPSGIFEFDQGIVDVSTINMGVCSGNSSNSTASGTLTVGAATLVAGGISLANASSVADNCSASGTLNILGGTVNCAGSIIKTTFTQSTGVVAVTSGGLIVGGAIGSSTNPVDMVTLSDATLTLAAASSPSISVTTLETYGSSNLINIVSVPTITGYPVRLPLIRYTGTVGGAGFDNNMGLGALPDVTPAYQAQLLNNMAENTIELVITGGPTPSRSLVWNGVPTGDWDTTTANWLAGGSATTYNQNDTVLFNDTATGTTTVNLTTALEPVSLTVDNAAKPYTFSGSGSLSGSVGLAKRGAGSLTLANTGSNDLAGPVVVEGGTLQQATAANRLPSTCSLTLSNAAGVLLDLNNLDLAIGSLNGGGAVGGNISLTAAALTINGSGSYGGVVSGAGMLIKGGTGTLTLSAANLYTGGTLVNTGTVVLANSAGSGTGPGAVVIAGGTLQIGTNGVTGSIAPQTSGFITNHGILRFNRSDTLMPAEVITGYGAVRHSGSGVLIFNHDNSYTNTTTVDRNDGVLRISTPNALGTLDGGTTVTGGNGAPISAGGQLEMSGGVVFAPERLTLGCRGTGNIGMDWVAPSQFVNHDGTNTWTGPIDITTGGIYIALQSDSGLMRIEGSIAGGPTATGPRMLVLRGAADGVVSGVISNGPVTSFLSVCKGDGGTWTLSGTNSYGASTIVTNTGTLLINGLIGGTNVNVMSGTLGGTGVITAPVTVSTDGTVSTGPTVGTLTIASSLTSSGNFAFKVNKALPQRNDSIAVTDDLTYAGAGKLTVANVGPGLVAGDNFKLFNKPVVNGSALTVESAGSVVWANKLELDGSIEVISAPPVVSTTPTNVVFSITPGKLNLSWPDSYLGWSLQIQTNSAGLGPLWFTVPGSENVTSASIPIDPANPSVFSRLKYTP